MEISYLMVWMCVKKISYPIASWDFLFYGVMEISYFMGSWKFSILWHYENFLSYGVMEISYLMVWMCVKKISYPIASWDFLFYGVMEISYLMAL